MALSSNLYSQSTVAYTDDLFTSTLMEYMPTVTDQIFQDFVLFSWLKSNGSMREIDGGERIFVPLAKSKNTTAGFYSMYENIDITPNTPLTGAYYEWKELAVSIAIAHKEERQNSGGHRILPLLQSRIDNARQSIVDVFASALFNATQISNAVESLNLLVDSTGTVGQIPRSTSTWWAATETASGSFASQGLSDMRTLYNTVSSSGGKDSPDFIITTQSVYEFYEGVLQPQERFADPVMADGGFESLRFKTAPVVYDQYCTSGNLYMLNSKYINYIVDAGTNFAVSPFVNQAANSLTEEENKEFVRMMEREFGELLIV